VTLLDASKVFFWPSITSPVERGAEGSLENGCKCHDRRLVCWLRTCAAVTVPARGRSALVNQSSNHATTAVASAAQMPIAKNISCSAMIEPSANVS